MLCYKLLIVTAFRWCSQPKKPLYVGNTPWRQTVLASVLSTFTCIVDLFTFCTTHSASCNALLMICSILSGSVSSEWLANSFRTVHTANMLQQSMRHVCAWASDTPALLCACSTPEHQREGGLPSSAGGDTEHWECSPSLHQPFQAQLRSLIPRLVTNAGYETGNEISFTLRECLYIHACIRSCWI